MRVIVVGCGRVGSALASQLYKKGYQVTVIDEDLSAFDNLPIDFHGRLIEGDVLVRNVLHRAEIEHADALAAVTSSDSLNALVAHIAKTEYEVSKVVARNFDPRQRPLQEAFGIPVVGSASWGAQRITELLSDDPLRTILTDKEAKLAIYQLEVPEEWHGRSLQELLPEERVRMLAWRRLGQTLPVKVDLGNTANPGGTPSAGLPNAQLLETGDVIYLSADPEEIEALRSRLVFQQEHKA